jgi:hypothetical protein
LKPPKKWDLLGISPTKYGKSLGMLLLYIYHWVYHNFSTSTVILLEDGVAWDFFLANFMAF